MLISFPDLRGKTDLVAICVPVRMLLPMGLRRAPRSPSSFKVRTALHPFAVSSSLFSTRLPYQVKEAFLKEMNYAYEKYHKSMQIRSREAIHLRSDIEVIIVIIEVYKLDWLLVIRPQNQSIRDNSISHILQFDQTGKKTARTSYCSCIIIFSNICDSERSYK